MTIASLNVNGIRSHLDEIQMTVENKGIHIFAMSETKLSADYPSELTDVPGFQQVRLDRSCYGGGVIIYIRNPIVYKTCSDIPTDDLELLCVEIIPPRSRPFLILSWYRPPGSQVECFQKLQKILSYLDNENKEIILLGDNNCDITVRTPNSTTSNDSLDILRISTNCLVWSTLNQFLEQTI